MQALPFMCLVFQSINIWIKFQTSVSDRWLKFSVKKDAYQSYSVFMSTFQTTFHENTSGYWVTHLDENTQIAFTFEGLLQQISYAYYVQ